MTRIASLWAAIITGLLSTLVIPAAAWAEQSGVAEGLRRGRGFNLFGVAGALCCLVVVGAIVLVVVLTMKRKR